MYQGIINFPLPGKAFTLVPSTKFKIYIRSSYIHILFYLAKNSDTTSKTPQCFSKMDGGL